MPSHQPTKETRNKVEAMSAIGIPQHDIARVLGIHDDTLRIHYREELDTAAVKASTQVGGALFKKAVNGDTAAAIFWMKTRMGWKETTAQEFVGKDGEPLKMVVEVALVGKNKD